MKRQITGALLAFLLLFGMTSCGTAAGTDNRPAENSGSSVSTAASESTAEVSENSSPEDQEGRTVRLGVLVWKFSDPYGASVREAISRYADILGPEYHVSVDLEMVDAEGNMELQERQADAMFASDRDMVIINLADTLETQYIGELAEAAQKPVLFYNREPQDIDIIRDIEAVFVGMDAELAGRQQAELFDDFYRKDPAAIDRNGDGRIAYLLFEGENDNPEAIVRTESCIRTLMDLEYTLDALAETQVADWDEELAEEMMTALFEEVDPSDIEAIFCNNDAMAIGVINALQTAGYNLPEGEESRGHICILGVDATKDGLAHIRSGQLDGTVLQDADAMGEVVIRMALNRLLRGSYTAGTEYELSDDLYSYRMPCRPITVESLEEL